ncbi:Uma2 family endonuclease [Spiractinospora alimapuensis]|uniref:Uma2 family endonuclease n=1 Tax=Spiractinospora alimapuensis TaxID=2820884 RepID=UPI001F212878|nr:Uma2 family endonuclease [Spiractinospora alimapuensis]QVQ54638.1 Uma2 family endonuclease [Spiractinospora alimapuensis]
MCAQPVPEWLLPPAEGFTADDLDDLPDLPPHTELIDGSLVLVSPQKAFHTLMLYLIEAGLRRSVPEDMRVRREMTMTLAERQRLEPDLMVVDAGAVAGADQSSFPAEAALLVIEVVSPESVIRDRERKPQLYAQAGIPNLWRVEPDQGRPVVYTYERDPATGEYVATGIHRDKLSVAHPFTIDIDLTEIDTM